MEKVHANKMNTAIAMPPRKYCFEPLLSKKSTKFLNFAVRLFIRYADMKSAIRHLSFRWSSLFYYNTSCYIHV